GQLQVAFAKRVLLRRRLLSLAGDLGFEHLHAAAQIRTWPGELGEERRRGSGTTLLELELEHGFQASVEAMLRLAIVVPAAQRLLKAEATLGEDAIESLGGWGRRLPEELKELIHALRRALGRKLGGEVVEGSADRSIALLGRGAQTAPQGPMQPAGHGGPRDIARLVPSHGGSDFFEPIAGEWELPVNGLVQSHAKAEDVRAGVDRLAGELLRRHVPRRADDRTGFGERRRRTRLLPARPRSLLGRG